MKFLYVLFISMLFMGCVERQPVTADQQQAQQQEAIVSDFSAQIGMPAIKNGRERKIMKDILELRDQGNYVTYTYTHSDMTNKFTLLCESIGYPIPYATQYTNPMRPAKFNETSEHGNLALPQADPSGLFSPTSADATWIMCKDDSSNKVAPVYVEPKLTTLPFKLPARLVN